MKQLILFIVMLLPIICFSQVKILNANSELLKENHTVMKETDTLKADLVCSKNTATNIHFIRAGFVVVQKIVFPGKSPVWVYRQALDENKVPLPEYLIVWKYQLKSQ